ncbi:SPOR domain-containing protein [Chitinivorax sp. PXF-14]|uniref:SPOR domain-containing protein n=1 Tax=Chitinivorax sp. PXF-14 TaxID=3230488 RepID=UPI0034677D3A
MKWLFAALVLVNLGVFGYLRLSQPVSVDSHQREFHPEQVKLLPASAVPTAKPKPAITPAATPPTTPAATQAAAERPAQAADAGQCQSWEHIPAAELSRARQLLATLKLGEPKGEPEVSEQKRYWVYLPPFKSLVDAQKRTDELKTLGLADKDFFIVNDAGANRNAVSLGVYSTEEAARQRLEAMQDKGVRGVRSGLRESVRMARIVLAQPDEDGLVRLNRAVLDVKGSELRATDCPG